MCGAIHLAIGPKNIGKLEPSACYRGVRRRAHGSLPQARVIKLIEGGGGLQEPPAGEVKVVERRANTGMAQQPLDGVGVIARFQQVGGEGMPERISTLLIIRR